MSAMRMLGSEYDTTLSALAWDYLLKAHPHDSINGVTQDKTADDVMFHLAQAEELADILYQRGMRSYIKNTDLSEYGKNDLLLVVYNPLAFDRKEVIKVSMDIPSELNAWDLAVHDDEGNAVDIQPVDIQELWVGVHDPATFASSMPVDRHIFYLNTGVIPAGGCRVYKIDADRTFERSFVCGLMYSETSTGREIAKTDTYVENEYLIFEVNPEGTVKIIDKLNNRVYDGMHVFEDAGEVGDYWINLAPKNNRIYTSKGLNADIWLENNGELAATIGMRQVMRLPKEGTRPHCFHAADSKRSDNYAEMEIVSYFTLKKGEKKIDIRVETDNIVRDHRLRVLYPTGIDAEYSYAAGHFNVDRRPVMPSRNSSDEYYLNMQTLPQQAFVDVTDREYGVAFINNCLTEFELKNDGKGTLALTLLKSVKNTICTSKRLDNSYPEQSGGQCLGRHTYEYAIYPHSGDWQKGNIYEQAQKFNVIPAAMQTAGHCFGRIRPNSSMYRIEDDRLVLSAFKKAEDRDSIIMRVINPTDFEVESMLEFIIKPQAAFYTSMNEERIDKLDLTRPIRVGGHKIVTIELIYN